jgi:twitching motility protein PilU
MTTMLKVVLQRMAENKASDAFISAGAPIYFKIKGQAIPVNKQIIEPQVIKEMAYGAMTDKQIQAFEASPDLNFSMVLAEHGNFRINVFRQRGTVALAARYIPFEIPGINALGLPPLLGEQIMEKRGLILVVGSTGAGKSTTLAAMLNHRINHNNGHVLTLEDPVEYLFKHGKSIVNQRDVGQDSNSYHEALKSALRQAPDCLMIGEIRDQTAMTSAINFALSGHLCVATLHANNSYHALTRIINMYPLENRQSLMQDLAVSLKSIIAQRLITDSAGQRVPVVEILTNATHIRELIDAGDVGNIREAMEKSLRPEIQTFDRALQRLFEAGRIDRQTALDNADSPTNLSLMLGGGAGAIARPSGKAGQGDFEGFKLIYGDAAQA